jgi:hypothetical protein
LGAALDYRHHAKHDLDCSHLVHELYERAGFPYEYASSSDLYVGIAEFRRVNRPQPGDLAVWRGHVGIVVSPLQHSFFSLLSSGPGVDSYDARYWKRRGSPRFFRYVKTSPARTSRSQVVNANWKRPDSDSSGDPSAGDRPDESEGLHNEIGPSQSPAQLHPPYAQLPRVIVVNAIRPKPEQVREAFLQSSKDWERQLRGQDLFQSSQSLIVFDHFQVRKLHIKGDHGWADVRIEEAASLVASRAEVHRRSVKQRWSLTRRDSKTWELMSPQNTAYLTQPVAVNILATELAQLTKHTSDVPGKTQQKAALASLLNFLLNQ